MAKKSFKDIGSNELSPALRNFITTEPEPVVEEKVEVEAVKVVTPKAPAKEVKAKAKKEETKSKRVNLLIKPSVFEDIEKITTMEQTSVNNLINELLTGYRDAHKNLIDKYNEIFKG